MVPVYALYRYKLCLQRIATIATWMVHEYRIVKLELGDGRDDRRKSHVQWIVNCISGRGSYLWKCFSPWALAIKNRHLHLKVPLLSYRFKQTYLFNNHLRLFGRDREVLFASFNGLSLQPKPSSPKFSSCQNPNYCHQLLRSPKLRLNTSAPTQEILLHHHHNSSSASQT